MDPVCSLPIKDVTPHFWCHRQDTVVESVFGMPSSTPEFWAGHGK